MVAVAMSSVVARPFVSVASRPVQHQRGHRLMVRASGSPKQTSCVQKAVSHIRAIELPAAVKPAATAMVANLILALPAAAEPGKIFDFNLTLPIMIAELLALVVFLNLTWFTPLGNILEERDSSLRGMLRKARENVLQIEQGDDEVTNLLESAERDVAQAITLDASKLQKQLDDEFDDYCKGLDNNMEESMKAIGGDSGEEYEKEVKIRADEFIKDVAPEGFSFAKY
mmetsp:Transcript_5648/g.16139  ORF Transcript_5648/g.16139 Transcript_5648/m.16139 type:complete len:227 (+) Transcript_5648:80-760(+)|eukprot:CAMPEP_0206134624 /NCGR_PEP_ID=MMETSP1473-20131121/114_1 /ASSEMBLY_ACC=CAM_ASM_001109 /TAXON_ID=1461547 /ORGANISM="Stichococcus sp, Strain RCC1054" /LENGTH=226 /DNA_ID=CAMNT_0053526241 /DNA_START=71 /DNA_END=751 /DNA_ORIENTATION=+